MRAETIIIPVFVVALLAGLALFFAPDVNVSVEQPTAQAQAGLPDGVEKFQDGNIICYTYNKWNAWTSAFVGGISCLK